MDYKKLIEALARGLPEDAIKKLKQGSSLPANDIRYLKANFPELPVSELLCHYELLKRAKIRFADAHRMVFTEKGLSQCSTRELALYHAKRIGKAETIADLCCGIGSDLSCLAENRKLVYALDADADALLCAGYNTRDKSNIHYIRGKAEDFGERVEVIFSDPDRRAGGRRRVKAEEMQPALRDLLIIPVKKKLCSGMLIKLAPALDYHKVDSDYFGIDAEFYNLPHTWEFISEKGSVKEILLCCGTCSSDILLKAVLLPQGIVLEGDGSEKLEVTGWQGYIFEPDKAIIRAGLVQRLGRMLNYRLLDPHLALLSGTEPVDETFGKCYELIEVLPFKRKLLQKYFRDKEVGELVIKTRGFPETAESLVRQFRLRGSKKMIILIVRINSGHQVAILQRK
jgi:SAM-dependent methyltransferase